MLASMVVPRSKFDIKHLKPDAVRLSAAHYTTPEEFDRFLKATKELGS